jgi:hypothetical protein
MAQLALGDVQVMIDKLFEKLEAARSGGAITQYNQALRVQITRKKQLGGTLSEREREIVAALGEIAPPRRSSPLGTLVLAVLVIGALYVAYRYLAPHHP